MSQVNIFNFFQLCNQIKNVRQNNFMHLTPKRRNFLPYRNQSINLHIKSVG